jgi:PAS domain S-box-containing protein
LRDADIILLIFSSLLGFFLALYIYFNRRSPGSQALSVLILAASLWSIGYAFELIAKSPSNKLIWEKFEYLGIVTIPLAWFTFVSQYLGNPKWMKEILKHRFILGFIPTLTLILVWTNELHNLVWHKVETETIGSLVTLNFIHGPWFWVEIVFSYTLILLGSVQLAISVFSIVRLQRWQIFLTLMAILLPWIGNIFYITGLIPKHFVDWMAFLFLISGLLFSISLFRFQLAKILPIAQEAVFAGMADSVLVLDLNNHIVEMNSSAKEMAENADEEPLGKNIIQVRPALGDIITQAGDSDEYRTEFVHGEGSEQQYYDLHISLLKDTNKNPIGRLIVLHQITKLKLNQDKLEHLRNQLEATVSDRTEALKQAINKLKQELKERSLAEKRFEDVIESAPDAMFILDQTEKILHINAMAERLLGYPREDLIGMNINGVLLEEDHREHHSLYFHDIFQNSKTNQSSGGVELFAKRRDGSQLPIEVESSRLTVSDGFWVAINVRDISQRKLAEKALRESEHTYRALFENAGDAIFLTNLEGKILQVNQKSTELLGFSTDELQTLSIFDITIPDEIDYVKNNMDMLLHGNLLKPYIRHYLKKSGEVIPTENNTVLVRDVNGKPKFFQNISRDMSNWIKSQNEQRLLLKKISESNEQLRDLALRVQEVQEQERQELAGLLHDQVGQNLTGLNLNLKILLNQIQSDGNSEIQKRLEDSLNMVEETTRKIRGVMADLNPPILDEFGLIAAIKWYCDNFSSHTGISTHVDGNRDKKRLTPIVERILYRLVQESLMNVAKHAQASQVSVSVVSTKEAISVTIRDNGIGFDQQAAKVPSSEPHWGMLSMQRKAASIGASLNIESMPGTGTMVNIKVER